MKKLLALLLCLCLLSACVVAEAPAGETVITLGETITVNGAPITEDASAPVYLALVNEKHGDVPEELKDLNNRVVTIAAAGVYRLSGTATDCQIAVRAGENDDVRLILDGVDVTCRTAPGIAVFSARDPRTPGEYGVCVELAEGSVNKITGSHTKRIEDTDIKLDGAVDSLVSIGFEGSGSLTVDADNEGIECKYGHMTINGGTFDIQSGDDPLNVSEDGVGVLTVNAGYVFSAVKNVEGGEGDGIDSNGWIIFNGGTIINLAHPASMDSGIDSDMGSSVNGGVIVGAGNMYDPIEADSKQLFMMLEFAESTDDVVVVTKADGTPVFAYDFPYDYMYIAFSTPDLAEGETYHVYLGGEVTGEVHNGLYSSITAYVPGRQMQHGEGRAEMRTDIMMPDMGEMPDDFGASDGSSGGQAPVEGQEGFGASEGGQAPEGFEASEGGQAPEGFEPSDGAQAPVEGEEGFGASPGGPADRTLQSSADVATTDFVLTRESTGFTNIREATSP